jgi:predicted permease
MKLKEKVMFSMFGVLIFFISGGVACTYSNTGVVNPVLAVILGVLVFFTVGGAACTYGNNKTSKQESKHTVSKATLEA